MTDTEDYFKQIAENRKEAEDAGWIRLSGPGPEEWGWCGYRVMKHAPGEWWAYHLDRGLGISEKTRQLAQMFCEEHYDRRMDNEMPRPGEPQ